MLEKKLMPNIFRRVLVRNTSWLLLGQVISLGAQVLYFIVLARILGSEQYGIYVAATALVGLISQYGTLGAGFVFLRHVCTDYSRAPRFWGNIVLSSVVFGPLFVTAIGLIGIRIFHNGQVWLVPIVAVSDCLCGALTVSVSQVFQTFERMQMTAIINLAGNILRLLLASYLFITAGHIDATRWSLAALLASLCVLAISIILAIKSIGPPEISMRNLLPFLWEGFVFSVSTSSVAVYNDIDKTIMGSLGMNRANGAYSLAYKIINIFTLPFIALYSAAVTGFFRAGADGIDATLPMAKRILIPCSLVGAILAALIYFCSPIVTVLVGKDFETTTVVLRWLCFLPLLRNFQWCAGDALVGAGYVNTRVVIQIAVGLFNLIANLYIIPKYSWRGATWSSLATDTLLAVALWSVVLGLSYRRRKHPSTETRAHHA
jgi:O-antigen/teichoic acid export membrane protein